MTSQKLEPGVITGFEGDTFLARLRNGGKPWTVMTRASGSAGPFTVVHRSRRQRDARLFAQTLRSGLTEPDHVIDIYECLLNGWRFIETLPRLYPASIDDGKEIVWGNTAEPVALVEFEPRGGWRLWMLTDRTTGEYSLPDKRTDAFHYTHAEAFAAARRLANDEPASDELWPDRWHHARRVTLAAGHATLTVPIEFVGPTGLTCSYPECTDEAQTRVSMSGTDIAGEPPKLCCYPHAGLISAPLFRM